jgi:hypothetical protein
MARSMSIPVAFRLASGWFDAAVAKGHESG